MELSTTERDMLHRLARGEQYKQIAYATGISVRVVTEKVRDIKLKMNAATLFELGIRYSECQLTTKES